MADVSEVRAQYRNLLDHLEALNSRWAYSVVTAAVFPLPVITLEQRIVPKTLSVGRLVGSGAIDAAAAAFIKMEREVVDASNQLTQHPGSVFRLPGWIAVQEDLSVDIAKINGLKTQLEQYLQTVPERQRPRFNSQALPRVSVIQVTRHLRWLPAPLPYHLCFSWIGNSSVTRKMTTAEALLHVRRGLDNPPEGVQPSQWRKLLESQEQSVLRVPENQEIVFRRRQSPHPRVELIAERGNTPYETFVATLPIFLYCPAGLDTRLPSVTNLSNLTETRRNPRRDKGRLIDLVPEINLYMRVR